MDDILINLEVPSITERFDLFVPPDLKISTLTEVIANSIQELANGTYMVSGQEMLMLKDPEKLLNPAKSLADYDIRDGAGLIIL